MLFNLLFYAIIILVKHMINNNWDNLLKEEFKKEYFKNILNIIDQEKLHFNILPKEEDIFNAFKFTDYDNVKCVILGQDPYHGINQAHGLAFSVNEGIRIPPSLKNIFKELNNDLGLPIPNTGNLSNWAREGVLLLNCVLTVRENNPNSHKNIGWEIFTNKTIEILNKKPTPIVFILWGNYAKSKLPLITNKNHLILTGSHPSPLSSYNGFFGGKYFSKTNDFLIETKQKAINWKID